MDDLEVMDLFTQFAAGLPDPEPSDPAGRVVRALRDRERLGEIDALRLTEPDVQHILRDVCREASSALGLPMALVTIVLADGQHFAAQHGLNGWLDEAKQRAMEWSFCLETVADRSSVVVNDARTHHRFEHHPLVREHGLRSYAGMPLTTSRGHAVGSLCVAGLEAREFSGAELETLQRFASEVVRRIETRRVPLHS